MTLEVSCDSAVRGLLRVSFPLGSACVRARVSEAFVVLPGGVTSTNTQLSDILWSSVCSSTPLSATFFIPQRGCFISHTKTGPAPPTASATTPSNRMLFAKTKKKRWCAKSSGSLLPADGLGPQFQCKLNIDSVVTSQQASARRQATVTSQRHG